MRHGIKKVTTQIKRMLLAIAFFAAIAGCCIFIQLLLPPDLSSLSHSENKGLHVYTHKKHTVTSAERLSGQKALSEWGGKYVDPMRLVEQILNSNVLIGMNKTEVSKYMGDPVFPESEKLWFYVFLTEDGEWFLKMDLDHDVVAGAYLEHQEIR
ncbi:MAG: hypothetical protein QG632_829 [Candidatus Dependentiae bacterium]|nr:hypothetical protein [Candidatus Dependentiae bacterium]